MRTAYDFSPLCRSMIGVARMVDFIASAMRSEGDRSCPPHDVEKTGEDGYGRFERRLSVGDIGEDRIQGRFRNRALTLSALKSEKSQWRVKRIATNSGTTSR